MTLFCLPKNKNLEKWDGPRCGLENAIKYFKADEVMIEKIILDFQYIIYI